MECRTSAYTRFRRSDDVPTRDSNTCRKAIALNPGYATLHHWYALSLMGGGRVAETTARPRTRAHELQTKLSDGWLLRQMFARLRLTTR
jgi:hypothetical protein